MSLSRRQLLVGGSSGLNVVVALQVALAILNFRGLAKNDA